MSKNTSDTIIKNLTIEGNYNGFPDFYEKNKKPIYENIINLFGVLKSKEKEYATLIITTKITDIDWDTDLTFTLKQSFLLLKDILPFFEEIEEYETCDKIQSLYNEIELTNTKKKQPIKSR